MSPRRLLALGLVLAAAAGLGGGLFEWWRFGSTLPAAQARVEAHVRRDFERMSAALSGVAEGIARDPAAAPGLTAGPDTAPALFDLAERGARRSRGDEASEISVTIYDAAGAARAWSGRPSNTDPSRLVDQAYFVTQSPLGLRLVHVVPIVASDGRRVGAVAAEHVLSPAPAAAWVTGIDYRLPTPFGPASLRTRWLGAGDEPRPNAFVLADPGGAPLLEVAVAPDDLAAARLALVRRIAAVVVGLIALTMLVLVGPQLDRRAAATATRPFVHATISALLLLATGAMGFWAAAAIDAGRRPRTSLTLLLVGVTLSAAAAVVALPVVRLRVAWRRHRRRASRARLTRVSTELGAGVAVAAALLVFEGVLYRVVGPTVDLRHFSLHPWSGTRVTLLYGVLACQIAVLWGSTLVYSAALSRSGPTLRRVGQRVEVLALFLAPAAVAAIVAAARGWPVPGPALMLSAGACGLAAVVGRRVVTWYRHATVAARILTLFVAFLVPALLLDPSIDFFAERATRNLIATRYAVEAQNLSEGLQSRMTEAQREIDTLTILPDLVSGAAPAPASPVGTDRAFLVWRQTALAQARLTSAVELYDRNNVLISRFALNVPQYTGTSVTPQSTTGCSGWEVFGEAGPLGYEEGGMLHAERAICERGGDGHGPERLGTIIVHVVFDYRTLPFITSMSPYYEVFRPSEAGTPAEGTPGADVEIVIYGWGLGAIYTSARTAWPISDDLFRRIYSPTREPFWTGIRRDGDAYHVYFANDRARIYALGYPALTVYGHLVHLAELTTLAGAAYIALLSLNAIFSHVARSQPRIGRALLREIRASFYRKLFLAFVLASMVPVLTLAVVIRAFFARQLGDDIQAQAARTAAVAQRVIEDSDALLRRSADAQVPVSDDVMVWISQIIDQDVNIFAGPELLATSERDLFASGLLPTRTPDEVFRSVALQRLPSFVGEDRIGAVPYLIAAAPVRAGGRDAILTVPLANRQRDIEREQDDLDRGVLLAALVFIMFGAAIGLSMAERIADPVKRLTRATRRIARGDFDAQIAMRSADELRRLVDAFNSMAAELKAQRGQLERTHRLEAWAEMARQVAHEIKNPLTPIQLSAEHLRRVHADRGEPLGAVLESCVTSILGQVHLLRQISAEFSNFASSPIAKPTAVDVADLVADVIDPYRTGLTGRIEIVNRVAPPLPRAFVDRTLVARALANVVENALHAMPGRGTLTLDGSAGDATIVLGIRDTGIGMDAEALARVFEPYFSTKTTGTGLGLPVARRNVELSGGTIEVESEKGRGTLVRIVLPVEQPSPH